MKDVFYVIGLTGALGLSASAAWAVAVERAPSRTPSSVSQQALELIEAELQRVVDTTDRVEGQGAAIDVELTYDGEQRALVIDLGAGGVPSINGSEWEDYADQLSDMAVDLAGDSFEILEVTFRFDGQALEVLRPDRVPMMKARRSGTAATPVTVVVDPGHGVYYHHGQKAWKAQRDPHNGIIEDFLTPTFGGLLKGYLEARSGAQVKYTRGAAGSVHPDAGVEYWKMASRYFLKDLHPDKPSMWNSLSGATHALRERDEDIRSRPLYANFVAANYLIHLHSDGSENSSARGTNVLVQPGRVVDKRLGQSILCSMREVIRADPAFATWKVASAPRAENKGENRLATMPSVIVETGFHTNPDDAAALKNPEFQKRAAKGIEKGIRMFRRGIECREFSLTNVPSVEGPHYANIPVKLTYVGAPAYPLYVRTRIVSCPPGYDCSQRATQYSYPEESPGELTTNVRCTALRRKPGSVITLEYFLEDADDIRTKPVSATVTCR